MQRQSFKVVSLGDRHALIKLSDRIALITKSLKRPGKGGRRAAVVSAYFGFATADEAQSFIRSLRGYFPKAFCQLRKAERLSTAFEVKVRSFPALERFAWTVATQPAIVTPQQAKASIQPPIEPIAPVQPMKVRPIELAPLQIRSSRPLKVGRVAIE